MLLIRRFSFTYLLFTLVITIVTNTSYGQMNRIWERTLPDQIDWVKSSTLLPNGNIIFSGVYFDTVNSITKSTIALLDSAGTILSINSDYRGFEYVKIIIGGNGNVFAAATAADSINSNYKILVAIFDTSFSNQRFYFPRNFPVRHYAVRDICISKNNLIIASSLETGSILHALSVVCMDTAGNFLWERIDSIINFDNNAKLISDSLGGAFIAGSSSGVTPPPESIFISHYDSSGVISWTLVKSSINNSVHAEVKDFIADRWGNLYVTGEIADSAGNGFLMKMGVGGNIIWDLRTYNYLHQHSRIISDNSGNIYGTRSIYVNWVDMAVLHKRDSSGYIIDSIYVPVHAGYFDSSLNDIKFLNDSTIACVGSLNRYFTGELNSFFMTLDTSLDQYHYDVFDSTSAFLRYNSIFDGAGQTAYAFEHISDTTFNNYMQWAMVKYESPSITSGISLINSADPVIFPNPCPGNFNVQWSRDNNQPGIFRIYNSTGEQIFSDIIKTNSQKQYFNLELQPGLYYIIFENAHMRDCRKIFVIR